VSLPAPVLTPPGAGASRPPAAGSSTGSTRRRDPRCGPVCWRRLTASWPAARKLSRANRQRLKETNTKSEIRNTKSEIRNKFKNQKQKCSKQKRTGLGFRASDIKD